MEGLSYTSTESQYQDNHYSRDNAVKHYKEATDFKYPLLMLTISDDIAMYRLEAMRGILKKSTFLGVDGFNVYIQSGDAIVGIGVLERKYLKVILKDRTFAPFVKTIHLDPDTVVEGNMLFALCPAGVED